MPDPNTGGGFQITGSGALKLVKIGASGQSTQWRCISVDGAYFWLRLNTINYFSPAFKHPASKCGFLRVG